MIGMKVLVVALVALLSTSDAASAPRLHSNSIQLERFPFCSRTRARTRALRTKVQPHMHALLLLFTMFKVNTQRQNIHSKTSVVCQLDGAVPFALRTPQPTAYRTQTQTKQAPLTAGAGCSVCIQLSDQALNILLNYVLNAVPSLSHERLRL